MKKIVLLMIASILSLSTFAQTKASVDYKESSARALEPQHSVMIAPLIADLQVIGGSITYTETEAFANYVVSPDVVKFIPDFKKVALSRAARAHKADAIIGATVDVITNAQGRLEITISGYPAKYTNFRNATSDDIGLVQQGLKVMSPTGAGTLLSTPDSMVKREIEK